jgi:hypothetical protein
MNRFLIPFVLLISINTTSFAQHTVNGYVVSKEQWYNMLVKGYRQSLSPETQNVLIQFDSLKTYRVEFQYIGEGSSPSNKFKNYIQLCKTATDTELLQILACPTELAAIRAYAYMAYAYKCAAANKKELTLNYNFKVETINGCVGFTLSFAEFKTYCRKRNAYNPNPPKIIIPLQEGQVNKQENKIRQEQTLPKRK